MPFRSMGVVLVLAASLCAQQLPKPQTVFSSPDRWTNSPPPAVAQPIPVPPRVLELLKQDLLFQTIVEHLGYDSIPENQDWLVASEIDLGCTRGIIVVGQGRLRGRARMSPFWIFAANKAGDYQPPLAVAADRIQVRSHWWKACNEIRTGVSLAGPTFRVTRFNLKAAQNGTRFERKDSWTENPDGSFFPRQEPTSTPLPQVHRVICPGTGNPPPTDSRNGSCG